MAGKALTILFAAALTLWLGGTVALFLFVQVMFSTNREVAVSAAPILFHAFERYQLGLFVLAVASLLAWRTLAASRCKSVMLVLILLAGAAALVQTAGVSAKMQRLTAAGSSGSPEFRRLHGYSMMLYTGEALLLIAAACMLPVAIRGDVAGAPANSATPRTSPETAPV